jgi:hypothetical protein
MNLLLHNIYKLTSYQITHYTTTCLRVCCNSSNTYVDNFTLVSFHAKGAEMKRSKKSQEDSGGYMHLMEEGISMAQSRRKN